MKINTSPWLIGHTESGYPKLQGNYRTDVCIVGAGIAGVITAYFTLNYTNYSVAILEGGLVAHGATGHNAGQVTSYFEKPFASIVQEYGFKKAIEGQELVINAWNFLEEIFQESQIEVPFDVFTGYAGLSKVHTIQHFLTDLKLKASGGIHDEWLYVTEEIEEVMGLKKDFKGLYSVIPKNQLLEMLQTDNSDYCAVIASKKGCLNSALFSRKLLSYLTKSFPERISVFENTLVSNIHLKSEFCELVTHNGQVEAQKVVLCTNGFENFNILNFAGEQLNTDFHGTVEGVVGFMTGYQDEIIKPPIAISYYPKNTKQDSYGDIYYYLTRRNHLTESGENSSLVCVGGPEYILDEGVVYRSDQEDQPEQAVSEINSFLKNNFKDTPKNLFHNYRWHGLMGYTRTGLRVVGSEPKASELFYNLGCNGVGILPSIMGGERVARLLRGDKLPKSIFDPI